MKNYLIKCILAFLLIFVAMPMMGQDFMNIYFKDGTQRKFYLRGVTEFSTSQFDASGVKHNDFDFQHVKTPDFNYVYDLAKIDSITFLKFEEDKTRRDFSSAMTTVLTVTSDCESIDDAEKKLPQIKASEGVEDAWSDGHELFVKINKWETISFHFNHDDDAYENDNSSFENMRKMIPQLRKVIKDGHQPKVVVANQQHFDDSRAHFIRDHYKPLLREFAKCGFDTCYLQRPTLEFFARDIYQYDVVFLITHGNIYTGGHTFVTGENLGEVLKVGDDPSQDARNEWSNVLNSLDFFKQYENKGSVYRSYNEENRGEKTYWVGHPGLLESFFGTTQEGGVSEGFFPEGAIFFNTACRSMMNDEEKRVNWHSLADKFIDNHGLMLYLGYSESDSSGKKAGHEFFKSMLQGKSVGKAYQDLPPNYKKEESDEGAELKMWPEDSEHIFLVPTYTNEISSEKAQTNFNYNQTVEVEGFTTFNFTETTDREGMIAYTNPGNIRMGFEYSTNEELLGLGRFTDKVEVTYLTKSIDKGNVKFRASLIDLKPNNTYYYRAYTSDGSFINYGKPKSFSIYDKFTLSSNSASLIVGESSVVDIASGSGSYSIEKIEPSGVVTASIRGNTVCIEAQTAGTAIITVKDMKSGQSATIEVTVKKNQKDLVLSTYVPVTMNVNAGLTFMIVSGNGSYTVLSSNESVASAKLRGNYVDVSALAPGNATITVTDVESGQKGSIEVTVTGTTPDIPVEAVDLGLPSGTLWASYNVGASKPEEYGNYYAWGETETKNKYNWNTYIHCDGTATTCHDIGSDISGTQYDVAHIQWGNSWQMPTYDQFMELFSRCTYKGTVVNDVYGVLITSYDGRKSIFLPAGGIHNNDGLSYVGSCGNYWSSFISTTSSSARGLHFTIGGQHDHSDNTYRFNGKNVRPVISSQTKRIISANGVSFSMVKVEGGTFQMGSEEGEKNELPVHNVTLSDFYIGVTEVTQQLWQAVMGSNPSHFQGNYYSAEMSHPEQRPVEYVSWNDCQAFIEKLNALTGLSFRLPTEAEWEYAASGGNATHGYTYSGSNDVNQVAWYPVNSYKGTKVVATKSPNEIGIYDMTGNVMEWCQDRYGLYGNGNQVNPTGPEEGGERVIRGGGWNSNGTSSCRIKYRMSTNPQNCGNGIGLRLVLSKIQ